MSSSTFVEELVKPKMRGSISRSRRSISQGCPPGKKWARMWSRPAAEGLQAAGMTWAGQHPGDYGNVMYSQLAGKTSDALTMRWMRKSI